MKNTHIKIAYGKCPKCKKVIERVGVYKNKGIIGFTGANCELCGYQQKINIKKIEKVDNKYILKRYK